MAINSEAVEAAAKAIYAARGYAGISKTDTGETRSVWASSMGHARAALAAAEPLIREAIAQEIEDEADKPVNAGRSISDPNAYARMSAYDRAASIVRQGGTNDE